MAEDLPRLKATLTGRYTIERELGRGGMATVYLAEDLKHHRQVAVKVLKPELAATLGADRFFREIQVAAQLQHPHILPLLDSGEADGFFYYVMPFIEGESLRERLARHGELPVPDAVRILSEVVDALAHAHQHGVVHRDIKPDNILLSGRHALVMDFGVAKAVSEATGRQQLTTAGVALGTPAYMAPEQAAADPHLDHRVDIYAVGVLAYELLTGRPPFVGLTPQEVLAAHVTQAPEPVHTHRPTLSPTLSQVVMRCLAKRAADRWQTADELLAQLEPLTTPSGGITPTGTHPIVAPGPRRRWGVAAAGVAALTLLVVFLVGHRRHSDQGTSDAPALSVPSVAVLPFSDLSPQPGQEHFADGLTDEVIVALSKVPGLRVPGRASAFYFKNSQADLRAIADSLHVRTLLTATVQRAGERVRVRAELVNATDGFQLWSETYDRKLQDLFAVYDDVSRAIAAALQVRLAGAATPRVVERAPANAAAYNEYLLGQYHLGNRRIDSALVYLTRAVALDPGFARAWSALSIAHVMSTPGQWRLPGVSGWAGLRAAEAAAQRALALDSASPEAHTAAAWLALNAWRWEDAEREFHTALTLNPNYAPARHWHAILLVTRGDPRIAVAEVRRAEELDPLSWIIGAWVGLIAWEAGEREAAVKQLDRLIQLHPTVTVLRRDAGLLHARSGDWEVTAQRYAEFAQLAYHDSALANRWRDGLRSPAGRAVTASELLDSTWRLPANEDELDLVAYAGDVRDAVRKLRDTNIEPGGVMGVVSLARIANPALRRTPEFQAILRELGR